MQEDDTSRELLFVRILEKVRRIAKEQGNWIREEQVKAEFAELALKDSQLQMVYDYLAKHKVRLGEPAEAGEKIADGEESEEESLTAEERNYLQNYLDEIARLPVYTDGELEAFTIGAMAGDVYARERLAESFLGDVADIAKLYAGQGVALEDLIGEGNVALAAGIDILGRVADPHEARGTLAKLIMDAMEELIEANAVSEKTDKKAEERVNLVADKARELAEILHRKVTADELAGETDLSLQEIEDAMRMSGYKIEDLL